jgi:hypothetical protein
MQQFIRKRNNFHIDFSSIIFKKVTQMAKNSDAIHIGQRSNVSNSVTRLGEISPFGRYFLALGAFFSDKYRPKIHLKISRFWLVFCHKIP